jgi:hypothetical protein
MALLSGGGSGGIRHERLPPGLRVVQACGGSKTPRGTPAARLRRFQLLVLVLTFLAYMSYHLTRKCTSVVKSTLNPKVGVSFPLPFHCASFWLTDTRRLSTGT